jgi:hypothetical protein
MASAAAAQETTTGTIAGQVVDSQGLPIPGATVTITGQQGSKTVVTDAEGNFFAPFLVPGAYNVRVELEGFRPAGVENIQVALGQRSALPPITLRIGAVTEQVQVVAAEPVVDITATTVGSNLDTEMLARLPVQRQLSDVVYLAPGVASGGDVGRANPSISGGSGLENQYVIDGVNVSNSGYGGVGSYSIVFGSLGTAVPFDFVQEVQVKAGGYEAEFGQATGGIVQAVTKSGGNQFSGSGFVFWQPEQFQGDFRQTELPNVTREDEAVNTTESMDSDVGLTVGGPILRDRMFFFGAIDQRWNRTTLIAPIGVPLREELGPVDQKRQALSYSGKVTWQANPVHRFDFSVFGDPSHGDEGPQRREALTRSNATGFSEIDYGGHNQTLRYEGVLRNNWVLTASFARASNLIEETPSVDLPFIQDSTGPTIVNRGGIGFYEVGNDGRNQQFQAKTTYFWRGHEFRGGFLFEDVAYDNIIDRTGPTFVLPNGEQTVTGGEISVLPDPQFGSIYRVTRANTTNVRATTQDYWAFFVQDTWKMGRVTIKPGLRYEQQKLVGNLEDFTWNNNWAPRLGVIWDPAGDGRSKVFANYGRYFARIPNDLAARALSADAAVTRADYFDAALTNPVPEGVLAADATDHFLQAGLHAADFDPDSRSTYSDEYLAGFEYELLEGLSVGVNYMHRSFGRVLEDVGTAPMVAYLLDLPGLDSVEYFITNPTANTAVAFPEFGASFEEAIHDYDAVTFTADKRFNGRWALRSSYTWSRLHGTFEGFFRNDNGQSDPAISSLFDFPTNDPTYSSPAGRAFGYRGDVRYLGCTLGCDVLPNSRTHQFKIYANRTWGDLNVGAGFNAGSGRPLTPFTSNPNYTSGGEIPLAARGTAFQTVDGLKDESPFETQFDLHADYTIKVGNQRLVLLADVFNLFNRQEPTDYDNWDETGFNVPNPDFGQPTTGGSVFTAFQAPRQLRVGLRFEW